MDNAGVPERTLIEKEKPSGSALSSRRMFLSMADAACMSRLINHIMKDA